MAPALLAAAVATSALVASSGPLAINENGTYATTVLLGTRSVKLAVDARRKGLWVSCRVFEDDQCDVGVSGYPTYAYTTVEYGIRTFAEITVAGQVFTNRDIFVAYDPLNLADPSVQGYLGLAGRAVLDDTPVLGDGANVTTIALQLGTTAADSKLSFNSIDWDLLRDKKTTTKTKVDARVSCVRLPVARSNLTVDDCTFAPTVGGTTNYQVAFDSTLPGFTFEHTLLQKLEDRFLGTCTKVRKRGYVYTDDWVSYLCNASMKLPTITIQMSGWEFYLDPVDYTAPANATTTATGVGGGGVPQIKVLIGGSSTSTSWELGTPFLRKFPLVFNDTERFATKYYNLYCTENTTCRAVTERVIDPAYSGGRGGEAGGGGGGGGGDFGLDFETRRKRNKVYLSIGLSVGGVALLGICGCIFKCCRDDEKDGDKNDEKEGEGEAEVEVKIALTVGKAESPERETKRNAKAAATVSKRRSVQDDDSDGSSGDSSSSYDSESSEERRKERRRRRRRRHERRRARKEQETVSGAGVSTVEDSEASTGYVAAKSPRAL